MANIKGRFSKITEGNDSVLVGLIGSLSEENITYNDILKIAGFYNISTKPDKFGYSFITKEGAIKRFSPDKVPVNNYNSFLVLFR